MRFLIDDNGKITPLDGLLTEDEQKLIVRIIEDEMQIDDFNIVYPEHDRELISSILKKLR